MGQRGEKTKSGDEMGCDFLIGLQLDIKLLQSDFEGWTLTPAHPLMAGR